MALALTEIGNQRPLSQAELETLWPTAAFGLDFSGGSDGSSLDFLRLLSIFLGNGALYALAAGTFGALVEFVRDK